MRDPRELLALLTAKVQRFQVAPGGIPAITPEDVSHALGMIHSDEARLYARLKYAGQSEYAEGVALAIRRHVLLRKADKNWRIPRKDWILDMAYMMLAESIDPNVCPWCVGRAEVRPEHGPTITCSACKGTGKKTMRDSDRARLMGVAKSRWSEVWGERYKECQIETLDKWEDIFSGALRKRLGA